MNLKYNVMTILKDEQFESHFVCTVSKMNLKYNVMTILKDEHLERVAFCLHRQQIELMIWCASAAIYAKTDKFIWVLKILWNRLKK